MSSMLGIRDYNDYNWREYEVCDASQTPKASHYAACIFDTYYTDGGYSVAMNGSSSCRSYVRYYAFPSKDVLEQWVGEASQSKKNFFLFAAKVAEAQVQIRVDVGVSL